MAHVFSFRLLLASAFVGAGLAAAQHLRAQDAASPPAQSEVGKATDGKPADGQPEDAKPFENKPVDNQPADDSLDSILAALEGNVTDYGHSVPSFLCKEHVVSEMESTSNAAGLRRKVTDSIFRVRRSTGADGLGHLDESRVLTAVDGKPPPPEATEETTEFNAPMSVFGIFSGGLNLVSSYGKMCFRYKLRPPRKGHPADRIVIEFENLPLRERDPACFYTDNITGRAFVQPSPMRVVRMEAKMRDHEMMPGVKETWEWTIDYAPVTLGGKIFWMPATIRSKAVPNSEPATTYSSGTGRRGGGTTTSIQTSPPTYTLEAKYSDYHRLNVVSRIVPVTGDDDQSPPVPAPAPAPVTDPHVTDPYFDPELDSATPHDP
jgi:hypothetical protein